MRGGFLPLALVAAACLCAASPPGFVTSAGLLVVPGWMAFYAIATAAAGRRRWRTAYLVGLAHMLFFSFSVRHVVLPAYIAIGLVGGLYYVLAVVWTRALCRYLPGSLAFGLALAGTCWLRSNFVEIQYPHVQPSHCLYRFPILLGSLRWGSEIFVNLLLGVLAGGVVDAYRAWRVGQPGYRRSAWILGVVAAVFILSSMPFGAKPMPASDDRRVRLLLVEPRLRPFQDQATYDHVMRERVIDVTARLAGVSATAPPDLVVWPESIGVHRLSGPPDAPTITAVPGFGLAPQTRLLQGSDLRIGGGRFRVVALLVDAAGRYCGHQEKRRIVPGGEHAPFLQWFPTAVSQWVIEAFRDVGVYMQEVEPGASRALLETAHGVRFGAMVCFDNAFPEVTEDLAEKGAAFAVVISNESWYLGGAELHQMVAMTVCRAIECHIPIVRCTVDGATLVVDPDGAVQRGLPFPVPTYDSGATLAVELTVPETGLATVPPLRVPVVWLVLLSLLLALLQLVRRPWGRILPARLGPDPQTPPDRPSPGA